MPKPLKDVVIFIPGITGSQLRRGEKILWGFSPALLAKAIFTSETFAQDLAPQPEDIADAVLPDLTLLPGFWKIDGYSKITDQMVSLFNLQKDHNFFTFPYDWRLDNRIAAEHLLNCAKDWLKNWRAASSPEARLIIVAHSMGGLVARYFLEVLEGWKDTAALITFATPYFGSLNAVDALLLGLRKGPLSLTTLTKVVRAFPALYQLLPTYACIDTGAPKLQRFTDLSHPAFVDSKLVADAKLFHQQIRGAVDAHSQDPAYLKNRYRLSPVVGTDQKTFQFARIANNSVTLLTEYQDQDYGGDGTVPRVSATPFEYRGKDKEMFANSKHGSIQNDDGVITQLKGVITGLTLPWQSYQRVVEAPSVSLEVEDAYWHDEPVIIRTQPAEGLYASVVDSATSYEISRLPLTKDTVTFGTLEPGSYEVTISGDGIPPVKDSFVVVAK